MHTLSITLMAITLMSMTRMGFGEQVGEIRVIDANQAFREFQQVMPPSSDSSDVPKDVNAEAQNPQMLLATDNGFALLPIDLTRHEELSGLGSLKKALDSAKVKATELGLSQVATDVETWVEMHPWKAAFYTASALGFVAPELLSIPAMEALGFGVAGVHAGSVAAKIQSVIGPIAARSVFAIWQSAHMGGYGVANVNGGVRALIALTVAAMAKCNPLKDRKGLVS